MRGQTAGTNDVPPMYTSSEEPRNNPPAAKKPERTQLSGDLQAAAKIDRVLNKMTPNMAIATLEYLLGIYETKAGRAEAEVPK